MIEQGTTNDNGAVTLPIAEGGSVTAFGVLNFTQNGVAKTLNSFATAIELPTVDTIQLYLAQTNPDLTVVGGPTMTLNFTATTPVTSPDPNYVVVLPCLPFSNPSTGWGQTSNIDFFTGCADGSAFDVWAFATTGSSLAAWGNVLGQAFAPSTTANIPIIVDRTTISRYDLNVTGIPAGGTNLRALASSSRPGQMAPLVRFNRVSSPTTDATVRVEQPTAAYLTPILKGDVAFPVGTRTGGAGLVRTGATIALAQPWNVTEDVALFESRTDFNSSQVGRPYVNWTLSSTGQLGDLIRADFAWGDRVWSVVMPASRDGRAQPPALPAPFATYAPTLGEPITAPGAAVTHYDVAGVSGYGAALSVNIAQNDFNFTHVN
jgi:hypothetical protein